MWVWVGVRAYAKTAHMRGVAGSMGGVGNVLTADSTTLTVASANSSKQAANPSKRSARPLQQTRTWGITFGRVAAGLFRVGLARQSKCPLRKGQPIFVPRGPCLPVKPGPNLSRVSLLCFNSPMPEGRQRVYKERFTPGSAAASKLSEEERAAVNLLRAPTQKVGTKPRCGARLSKPDPDTGEWRTCSKPAGAGTAHAGFGYCKFHGGNTPAGKKAGARLMGRTIIEDYKKSFGDKDSPFNHLSPEEALLEEVRRSVAMVRWLEERIGAWEIPSLEELAHPSPGSLKDPVTSPSESGLPSLAGLPPLNTVTFKGTPLATDVNSWLVLYREERAHMVKVSKLAIDAGIAERMVRIAESQGQMLATAIRAVLHVLGLTPAQAELVPRVVPEILRQVAQASPQITINGEVIPA